MKKSLSGFILIFLFLPDAHAQFTWQALPNAPKYYRLDDIYFLNPNLGWGVLPNNQYINPPSNPPAYGQIWRTRDAGNTWQKLIDSSATYYRSIGFADSLTGWVGNLADTTKDSYSHLPATTDTVPIYQTKDGGRS